MENQPFVSLLGENSQNTECLFIFSNAHSLHTFTAIYSYFRKLLENEVLKIEHLSSLILSLLHFTFIIHQLVFLGVVCTAVLSCCSKELIGSIMFGNIKKFFLFLLKSKSFYSLFGFTEFFQKILWVLLRPPQVQFFQNSS